MDLSDSWLYDDERLAVSLLILFCFLYCMLSKCLHITLACFDHSDSAPVLQKVGATVPVGLLLSNIDEA